MRNCNINITTYNEINETLQIIHSITLDYSFKLL